MGAPDRHAANERIGFIDAVRGISALLVMTQHMLNRSHLLSSGPDSILKSLLDLGEAGVVAFFLVSGFIIPYSLEKYGHLGKFWINRLFRIYPLYLASYAAMACLLGAVSFGSIGAFGASLLAHLFLVQDYVGQRDMVLGSWTLTLEAIWYVAFSALFALGLHRRYGSAVACALALSAIAGALSLARVGHIPMGRVGLMVACLWGLVLYRRFELTIGRATAITASFILLAIIVADLTIGFHLRRGTGANIPSYRCVLLSWALGAFVFGLTYLSRTHAFWRTPLIAFLGRTSYSIYLVHGIVLFIAVRQGVDGFALLTVTGVATLVLATLTNRYIERPGIALAHRLGRSVPAPVAA